MSSKSLEKKFITFEGLEKKEDLDLKHFVIPFSYYFRKDERFIYDGSEKIPFSKRDPLYRSILLQEFGDSMGKPRDNY